MKILLVPWKTSVTNSLEAELTIIVPSFFTKLKYGVPLKAVELSIFAKFSIGSKPTIPAILVLSSLNTLNWIWCSPNGIAKTILSPT